MKNLDPEWEYVADTVMGGRSRGTLDDVNLHGRTAARLRGDVSLENNGGFVQMAFDLCADGGVCDASPWRGIELDVYGNDEAYDLRLRTDQLDRPWQSFRTDFTAPPRWRTVSFDFAQFQPHRTDAVLDISRLRRVGILAIGRQFQADIAVSSVRFFD